MRIVTSGLLGTMIALAASQAAAAPSYGARIGSDPPVPGSSRHGSPAPDADVRLWQQMRNSPDGWTVYDGTRTGWLTAAPDRRQSTQRRPFVLRNGVVAFGMVLILLGASYALRRAASTGQGRVT